MYKMEFKMFGLKCRVEVAVIFVVVGCLLCHFLFKGCQCGAKEGFLGLNPSEVPEEQSAPQTNDSLMNFFGDIPFRPDCCPSTYSNSVGCACLSGSKLDMLVKRGGNRTCGCSEY